MAERDPLVLEQQLCFALYTASRALTQRYRPLLEELGLTYPQYLVMLALFERGPRSVKDLGAALQLDSGTLSPLLKRMESAGLVRRTRSTADERSVVVELTGAGEALRQDVRGIPVAVARGLDTSTEEIAHLHSALTGFLAHLR